MSWAEARRTESRKAQNAQDSKVPGTNLTDDDLAALAKSWITPEIAVEAVCSAESQYTPKIR
jgi:hypothetical protein